MHSLKWLGAIVMLSGFYFIAWSDDLAPLLQQPQDLTVTSNTTIGLSWLAPPSIKVNSYRLSVGKSGLGLVFDRTVKKGTSQTLKLSQGLYSWKVGYKAGRGRKRHWVWSGQWRFAIVTNTNRTLIQPYQCNTHGHSAWSNSPLGDIFGQHGFMDPFEFLFHLRTETDAEVEGRAFNIWVLSEHGKEMADNPVNDPDPELTTNDRWLALAQITKNYSDGSFVGLRGFEAQTDDGGHINVIGSANVPPPNQMVSLDSVYRWIGLHRNQSIHAGSIVCQFNHPRRDDFNQFVIDKQKQSVLDPLITLLAVLSRADLGGATGFQSREEHYQRALNNGWHVGATGEIDNHASILSHTHTPSTGVWAGSLTQDGVMAAFRQRRVFARQNSLDTIDVVALDQMGNVLGRMGDRDIPFAEGLKFRLVVDPNRSVDRITMVRGFSGATQVNSIVKTKPFASTIEFDPTDGNWPPPEAAGQETWYYFRLDRSFGASDLTFSSPIWVSPQPRPVVGSLSVNSIPVGAKIIIDNADSNQVTPSIITGLTSGRHELRLQLTGYHEWPGPLKDTISENGYVMIEAGKVTDKMVRLVPGNSYFPIARMVLGQSYSGVVSSTQIAYYVLTTEQDVSYRITMRALGGNPNMAVLHARNIDQNISADSDEIIEFISGGSVFGDRIGQVGVIIWGGATGTNSYSVMAERISPLLSRTKPSNQLTPQSLPSDTRNFRSGKNQTALARFQMAPVPSPIQLPVGQTKSGYIPYPSIAVYSVLVEPKNYELHLKLTQNTLGFTGALFRSTVISNYGIQEVTMPFDVSGSGNILIFVADSWGNSPDFTIVVNQTNLFQRSGPHIQLNNISILVSRSPLNPVVIHYQISLDSEVTGTIFSPTGKVVAKLGPMVARRGPNHFAWVRNQADANLTRGIYILELMARDHQGHQTKAIRTLNLK